MLWDNFDAHSNSILYADMFIIIFEKKWMSKKTSNQQIESGYDEAEKAQENKYAR